jgi:hypothetical protein
VAHISGIEQWLGIEKCATGCLQPVFLVTFIGTTYVKLEKKGNNLITGSKIPHAARGLAP